MLAATVFALLLGPVIVLGAPQDAPAPESVVGTGDNAPIMQVNPFGSSEENRRLLKSYIKANLNEQANPDMSTWEQEVFFIFSLYDFDKNGQLDGLELMKLMSDFLSHHSQMPGSTESVVAMVDYLLQTQDQNQDGLLVPSELFSPPVLQGGDSEPGADAAAAAAGAGAHSEPKAEDEALQQQEGEADLEKAKGVEPEGASDTSDEQSQPPAQDQGQEGHQDAEGGAQAQEEQLPEEQGDKQGADDPEQNQQNTLEPAGELVEPGLAEQEPVAQQVQHHPPVHQGQPEI